MDNSLTRGIQNGYNINIPFSGRIISNLVNVLAFLILFPLECTLDNTRNNLWDIKSEMSAGFIEDTFILNLISGEKFSHCSVFVLQDGFENNVDRIFANISLTNYANVKTVFSVKYGFSNLLRLTNISAKFLSNSANESVSETTVREHGISGQFPISVSHHRRKSDECQIVILFVNDIRPEFMKQIYKLITPVYIPITRKDEDFYIFKTNAKLHERLFKMRELPSRIKYKIAVGAEAENDSFRVYVRTICFFCNTGGRPRLGDLPVSPENLPIKDVNYFTDFVWNLNGKRLRVAIPYIRAKVEADPPWENDTNARRGNWKMLFEKFLTVKFNFTYNMFVASGKDGKSGGGGTGVQLENGSWIGVTGDLISGKADLGIVIANTPKRIYYVDFTNSFYDIGCLTFVTAQPSRLYSPAALLWPFDLGMWGAIGVSVILSVICFYAAFIVMRVYKIGCGENWTLSEQIQFLLSTFLEQDSPVHPETHALRSFVALWFFYTMILTTVYRSKMVTLLAFPVLGELPKTFEELAFSDYRVGFMKHGDSAYNTLAASTDPVYVKLVNEMEIVTGVGLECLEKVVTEKYGCIAYDFALVHLRERNLSEAETQKLVFAPARTYNIWLGLATEGKSIYRQNFGKILSYARQFHLADIWDKMDMYYNVRLLKLDWWKSTNQTDKTKRLEPESDNLTMKHIAGAFYVLVGCLIISFVSFVQEIVSYQGRLLWSHFALRYWSMKRTVAKFGGENILESEF